MKSIRSLLLPVAALIGLTLGILFFVGVTVPLDFLDVRLEHAASALLKRDVRISGPNRLTISPTPRLELGTVSIGNPGDWPDKEGRLLKVDKGEAQLSLTKLLQGKLHIRNLIFDGVDLNLVTRADHRTNYRFDTQAVTDEEPGRTYGLSSLDR
ncbi:MAG: AsmA family protein, partial [Desulfofustis sp.]